MGLKQIATITLLTGALLLGGKGAYDLTAPPETGVRTTEEIRTYDVGNSGSGWTKLSKASSAIFQANSGLYSTVQRMTYSTVPLEYGVLRVFEQITSAKNDLETSLDDGVVFNDDESRQKYEATVSKAVSDLDSAYLKFFRATGTYAPLMMGAGSGGPVDAAYTKKLLDERFMDVGPASNAKLKEAYTNVGQSLAEIVGSLHTVYPVTYKLERSEQSTSEKDSSSAQKELGLGIAAGAIGLALALKRNNARGYMPGL